MGDVSRNGCGLSIGLGRSAKLDLGLHSDYHNGFGHGLGTGNGNGFGRGLSLGKC